MARVFITGSSTGLGLIAGHQLVRAGHSVVLHARDERRADAARRSLTDADEVVVGDLGSIRGAVEVAERANACGSFDAVIHNAGVMNDEGIATKDGLSTTFTVNVLAPYILTSLITPPNRLVYLSSSLHMGAEANLDDLAWRNRRWNALQAYSESKLHVLLLAFAVSRLRPGARSNAVDPGWVPTRMGGVGATDDLDEGAQTQVVLAAPDADDPLAVITGEYLHHLRIRTPNVSARDETLQDRLLKRCADLSGCRIDPAKVELSA